MSSPPRSSSSQKSEKMRSFPFLRSMFSVLFFTILAPSSGASEARLVKSLPPSLRQNRSRQYFEVTPLLPTDHLSPSCSLPVLNHSFGNTYGEPPFSAIYSPPSNCSWSRAVLELRASCRGDQYDRIAAVWLDGAELLRTSTAQPTDDGIFWKVRKDVTRYSSILSKPNLTLSVMLENIVDDVLTGVYHVGVSLLYYNDSAITAPLPSFSDSQELNRKLVQDENEEIEDKLGIDSDEFAKDRLIMFKEGIGGVNNLEILPNTYVTPADLIIPISGIPDQGFWFRIQNSSDAHSKKIRVPPNTCKAVLEVYVSFHGDDEFWYMNPPDSYIKANNLTTKRAHGSYREVLVKIDGTLVGSAIPFPVIFTGGINPLFWEPIVSIGAFNLPSYDLELTPFLGILLDGSVHSIDLSVGDSIPFWLVDANLHLWLDLGSTAVQAKCVSYQAPAPKLKRKSKFKQLDGSFKIEAKRKSLFIGWVNSTSGNLTTQVSQQVKFKNSIKFRNNGTEKSVKQKVTTETVVSVQSDTGVLISQEIFRRKYPLNVVTKNLPRPENDTYVLLTSAVHGLNEKYSGQEFFRSLRTVQNSTGWMLVEDHSVLSGLAETAQTFDYEDDLGCYSLSVLAANGSVVGYNVSSPCAASF